MVSELAGTRTRFRRRKPVIRLNPVWFHSSPSFIPWSYFVCSANDLGIDPISWGDRIEEARGLPHFRPDLVFIYSAESYNERSDHINIATWATEDRYIYEVEPCGELMPDPSFQAPDKFKCCFLAWVIGCIHEPGPWDSRNPYGWEQC